MITISPRLTPDRLEREARMRVYVPVSGDVDLTSDPQWAFTDFTSRPSSWYVGEWSMLRATTVALSPLIGQRPSLTPGLYRVWVKVYENGEMHVVEVGTLRIL